MSSPRNKKIKVAVHNGTFHPDDVFAVAILSLYLGKRPEIIRSRDPKALAKAKYLFDVGGIYNPKKLKFDHHQESFKEKRKNGVTYATAGLVWKQFGKKVVGSNEVFEKIDMKIIQPIDAEDNGVELYKNNFEEIHPYTFGDYIHALNPTWKEKNDGLKDFKDAVGEAEKILKREIKRAKDSLHAEKIILQTYKRTKDKRIIVLDDQYSGWKRVLGKFKEPLFVIKPVFENHNWHATAMNVEGFKFKNRLDFPKKWAGLANEKLQKITGVPDALFCHTKRFIVAAKSREGAIALARIAIKSKS
jgi:uncharacterized UPF0160 family protein